MSCAVLTDAAQIAFSVGSLDVNDPPAARPDCANTTDAAHTAPSTSTCRRGTMASLRRSGNERMRQMSGLGRARQRDHRHRRRCSAPRNDRRANMRLPAGGRARTSSAGRRRGLRSPAVKSCASARRRGAPADSGSAAGTRDALSGRTSRDRPGWRLPCRRAAGREHRRQLPTQAPGKPPALERSRLCQRGRPAGHVPAAAAGQRRCHRRREPSSKHARLPQRMAWLWASYAARARLSRRLMRAQIRNGVSNTRPATIAAPNRNVWAPTCAVALPAALAEPCGP